MIKYLRAARLKISDLRAFPMDFYSGFVALPIQIVIAFGFWASTMGAGEIRGFTAGELAVYFVSVQVLQVSMAPGLVVTWCWCSVWLAVK